MNQKTPVSILQEYCVANHLPIPKYVFNSLPSSVMNSNQFKCVVTIGDVVGTGVAHSKQGAKQDSARDVLEKLNVSVSTPVVTSSTYPKSIPEVFVNAVGELNEYSSKNCLPYPEYYERLENGQYVIECEHLTTRTIGVDFKKKQAKQKAAAKMLQSHKHSPPMKDVTRLPPVKCPVATSSVISDYRYNDKEVVDKYKEFNVFNESPRSSKISSDAVSTSNDFQIATRSEEVNNLISQLENMEISYTFCEIQSNPSILSVEFVFPNGDIDTIIETGKNKDEALKKALKSGMQKLK